MAPGDCCSSRKGQKGDCCSLSSQCGESVVNLKVMRLCIGVSCDLGSVCFAKWYVKERERERQRQRERERERGEGVASSSSGDVNTSTHQPSTTAMCSCVSPCLRSTVRDGGSAQPSSPEPSHRCNSMTCSRISQIIISDHHEAIVSDHDHMGAGILRRAAHLALLLRVVRHAAACPCAALRTSGFEGARKGGRRWQPA